MLIGLGQVNTTAGDLEGNRERVLGSYRELVKNGAELVVFPELVLAGYPPRDLIFKRRFVEDVARSLATTAAEIGSVPAVIGFVEANDTRWGQGAFNALAWCEAGEVRHVYRKCLLPNYDVFDEERYFEPGGPPNPWSWRGLRVGLTICEDIWIHPKVPTARHYQLDPVGALANQGIDLLINASASPWHFGKGNFRRELMVAAARRCGCPVVYCNLVGGNDELIFDGQSVVLGRDGCPLLQMAAFREDHQVAKIALPGPFFGGGSGGKRASEAEPALPAWADAVTAGSPTPEVEMVARALTLGLRDYAHKSGFRKAVLGLSGGIDSAVVAALAVEAFGRENVVGVSLPSQISSQHSRDDAAELAQNLGIRYETLPIAEVVESAESVLSGLFQEHSPDVTEENLQARSRGILLMALSNKFGWLLLTTGNKSEMAVGYCTLYGDMAGGLAVLCDVPKMLVFALARWFNRERVVIPLNTLTKPPSAELRPDQRDEDSLPPYPVLDEILRRYVEEMQSRAEIVAETGFAAEVVNEVCRKVDRNEYKRKQAAPGLKITPLAFGVGRRIPIVQKYVG